MTTQELQDIAMEEGAAIFWLWAFNKCENYFVKVTDEGFWYFVDTTEHRITREEARDLIDVYTLGYLSY